ncbi:paired amphipathic helix protein Sin3-like 5 isoform X1 [Oryza brachyantha]|nr:paired amphipathic helix protein Sin3-like 5 isoform X1 [Oryza brachyantha]XP_015693098.1 paired amphipathic helix protein Sin3-like 5 isoform X1 [Oryza brachyantha]
MSYSPDDHGDALPVPPKRAKTIRYETMQYLVFVKTVLPDNVYSDFLRCMIKFRRQKNISIEKCKQMVLRILDGHPRVIEAFQLFLQKGISPYQTELLSVIAREWLMKVKVCGISIEDYHAVLDIMVNFNKIDTVVTEDIIDEVKRIVGNHPKILEEFNFFLPYHLWAPVPKEQSCRSPNNSRESKMVLIITPDTTNKLDGIPVKATDGRKEVPQWKYTQDQNQTHEGTDYSLRHRQNKRSTGLIENPTKKGGNESPDVADDEEHKAEPFLQWSPSRENELPPKVDLSNCKHCTPSYCLLPKNCTTLQSSYQIEPERSIFNDSLVSVTSGTEGGFKCRTKNQYEENMFNCEDDLFESDMLLQRFRATIDFIKDLQHRVDSNVKIQEHLTPLHKRCIEQLYDDSGIDMLDALSESENTSSALAVILSRLNQKKRDFSEARLSLDKMCSDTIANNYYRSLDHRSNSFKQLDMKRMNPKALLAEDKQISKMKSYTDMNIYEDIGNIINYAYGRSCTTEDKPMMNWTELVKEFLSMKFQWPDLEDTVALKKVCEHCGMSKDFLNNIPVAVLANEIFLSSKRVESPRAKSNESSSLLDRFDAEVEEGEFIPDVENIRLRFQRLPTNNSGQSTYGHWNRSEEQYESRQDSDNKVDSSAYFGRTARACHVNRSISCCTLAVLSKLLQVMYERLLIAKDLSKGASTRDSYAEFKEELCNLIDGSTDNWSFEQHCLKFLGPNSYVLFTLDTLIYRVIKQICKIYPSREDSSVLEQQDRSRRTIFLKDPALLARKTDLSKEMLHHQNARDPSIELLKQDREEAKGCEPHGDAGKKNQNHFQRRRKRSLENGTPSFSQTGSENQSPTSYV